MNIALLDLNHSTRGVHNNTAPLGLGLLTRYVQKTLKFECEVRMFKDTEKAFTVLSTWIPDIVGIAQYSWNSELNLFMASWIKKANPRCLVIAGGPNLGLIEAEKKAFFKTHPFVNLCVAYDGEIPFKETVQRLCEGERVQSLCAYPPVGMYSYDATKDLLIDSLQPPPRLDSLDVFGPLYATRLFDEFLEHGYHPFLQTHRGCPFGCAFCHTSDHYYSRMLFLSPEIFLEDMEYLGTYFKGRHDVILYLANTNMSLFKEDFVIARIIQQTQKKYDWPKLINVNSGKNPQKLLDMLSLIPFNPTIALQTLTPRVLENINRINIPLEQFVAFQKDVLQKTGEISETELILCLPLETKESFLKTVQQVLDSGVQSITIYTLMKLKGTPLFSEENNKKYEYVIRHRVVPRQFSIFEKDKILDTEEVVVGTNTMSFDDYLELRGLCFTITVFFSAAELVPLKRLLMDYDASVGEWIFHIHARLKEFPELYHWYQEFMRETNAELFSTREELLAFFDEPKQWQALCNGQYGDNLLRKYKQRTLASCYRSVVTLALSELEACIGPSFRKKDRETIMEDIKLYLLTRDVKDVFTDSAAFQEKTLQFHYDVPAWLADRQGALCIEAYKRVCAYRVYFSSDVRKKVQDFIAMNKDADLSLQILYRDGSIKHFWPQLQKV